MRINGYIYDKCICILLLYTFFIYGLKLFSIELYKKKTMQKQKANKFCLAYKLISFITPIKVQRQDNFRRFVVVVVEQNGCGNGHRDSL